MLEILSGILIFVIWILLQLFVLPRFGIRT